jgi:hypothetical protein
LHDFGNGHELFDAHRPVLRRLMTAVVFLDSALSQDLARVLIYTRAAIFKKLFIFLFHFRYDEF